MNNKDSAFEILENDMPRCENANDTDPKGCNGTFGVCPVVAPYGSPEWMKNATPAERQAYRDMPSMRAYDPAQQVLAERQRQRTADNIAFALVAPPAVAAIGVGTYALGSYAGPLIYQAGVTAQTVPLTGGVAALSSGSWVAKAGTGALIGVGLEYATNPDASPASLTVSALGGAVGGATKLGLNAQFGLPNQWLFTNVKNAGTAAVASQVVGRTFKYGLNQTGDTTADKSWWTSPIKDKP